MNKPEVLPFGIVPKGYNKQAVEILEAVLERAKNGEILQLVLIFENDGRENDDGIHEYEMTYTGCNDLVMLIGHLEKMKYQTLKRVDKVDMEQ